MYIAPSPILLKEYQTKKNTGLIEIIINLILVHHGGRKAYLLEPYSHPNASETDKQIISYVYNLTSLLGMSMRQDILAPVPRFLITKQVLELPSKYDDRYLANLLGFVCGDHDYGNQNKYRVSFHVNELVTDSELMVEVCEFSKLKINEMEKYYADVVEKWTNILQMYNSDSKVYWTMKKSTPKKTRIKKVTRGDIDFIVENGKEYCDDLMNDFAGCSIFIDALEQKDRAFLEENFMLFRIIYLGFRDINLERFLSGYRKDSKAFEKKLCVFEQNLWDLLKKQNMLW